MSLGRLDVWPGTDHLRRLTDERGLFEHALFDVPRPEHGYCLDDVARALVVLCRESHLSRADEALADKFLSFTLAAVVPDGACHNRMNAAGNWTDEASLGDWWGRAAWGLGVAAVRAPNATMRARAMAGFRTVGRCNSPHLRATIFAALGAGEVALHDPQEPIARRLLANAVAAVGPAPADPAWPWPELRLTYANGAVAEALLLAGHILVDPAVFDRGTQLLSFLLRIETVNGHISATAVGGRGPGEVAGRFDQQPIEVACLADACSRAFALTEERQWLTAVDLAWSWFRGNNDSQTVMFDPTTGGGYDGLERHGANRNQGAESTLALLSTAQHARRLGARG